MRSRLRDCLLLIVCLNRIERTTLFWFLVEVFGRSRSVKMKKRGFGIWILQQECNLPSSQATRSQLHESLLL